MRWSISGMLRTVVVLSVCLTALAKEAILPQKLKWRLGTKHTGSLPRMDPDFEPSEACLEDWETQDVALSESADWSAVMFDASGRLKSGTYAGSTHMLGDYDLCLKVKATGWNYTSNATTPGTYYVHNFNAKYFRSFYLSNTTGVFAFWSIATCAPDTCTPSDITFLKIIKDKLPIFDTFSPDTSTIDDKPEAIAAVCVLSFFGTLVLIASLLDYKWARDSRKPTSTNDIKTSAANGQTNAAFSTDSANGLPKDGIEMETRQTFKGETAPSGESGITEGGHGFDLAPEEQTPSRLKLALLAFSLQRSLPKVTSAKVVPGAYGCIHGIRFLTMAWILLGHCYQLGFNVILPRYTVAENYFSQFELMGRWSHNAINEMSVCVDSFFVMGGCLVAISFMKALSRQNNRPTVRQMLLYYFHRYWRLTPVYMILLMVWACLWRLSVSGPNLPNYWADVDECKNEWWFNMVYLNNFLGSFACMGWTWYLANDFQFYVFSPVVMIPLYMWPIPGITFIVLCMLGSFGSSIYTLTMVFDREMDYYTDFYIKPWCRYTSYGIGTLLGYIMYKTKCKVKMSKLTVVAYWAIILFMLLYPIWCYVSTWWPKEAYVAYESTRKHGFGLGVAMLIFACTSGYGGLINTFLCWKFFIPLSRLTYIGYLIHPMVIYFFQYNSHQMIYVNDTNVLLYAGGVMFYTIALSFILTLVFEVPMLALEKAIIPKAKKSA